MSNDLRAVERQEQSSIIQRQSENIGTKKLGGVPLLNDEERKMIVSELSEKERDSLFIELVKRGKCIQVN
ncbi:MULTISPECIES: hypothetical protein [Bacillus]|uniref:hypothetical protein n=1 Tax=Bacillus TaxID=1386 RepID=UPI0003829329|nr:MULTISPECIES: hypothetical protein [Bacillus]